jgi:hypothetical protein
MSESFDNSTRSSGNASEVETLDQRLRVWVDLMETCEQLLRAGLQASLAPGETLERLYRNWHEERAAEHGEMILNMAREFQKRLEKDASAANS